MKQTILTHSLKGLVIGGTMTVPGVSGGSMAMILGIYDKLVYSVSSFFKHPRESVLFLSEFVIGALVGLILFSGPLLSLIHIFPKPTLYFFIGAVAGGIPIIGREARVAKINSQIIIYPMIGITLVLLIGLIPDGIFSSSPLTGYSGIVLQIIAGLLISVALILPGISVSYMLLVLGMYEPVMAAISSLHFISLIPLVSGLVLGIFLTTSLLERAMSHYPQPTYLIILGFILGSLREVFPGLPTGMEIPVCLITLAAGGAAVFLLSAKEGNFHQLNI